MTQYEVRLEFDVVTTDFADLVVNANSPEEAVEKAIEKYKTEKPRLKFYSSEERTVSLNTEYSDSWNVEEIEKT